MQHVFLIDGSGFIFRAFHGLPPMTRPDGTPVNAVYGFTTMLLKTIEDTDADHVAVIFDKARRTFRNDIYPEYKAHRPPPPDELIPQFALVRDATEAMNVTAVDMDGYELSLKTRMDPTASILRGINARARSSQARIIFAEGDDERVLRAAVLYQRQGFGKSIVVGRESDVRLRLEAAGLGDAAGELEVVNAANTEHLEDYKNYLYQRLQRKGFDTTDVHRLAARRSLFCHISFI